MPALSPPRTSASTSRWLRTGRAIGTLLATASVLAAAPPPASAPSAKAVPSSAPTSKAAPAPSNAPAPKAAPKTTAAPSTAPATSTAPAPAPAPSTGAGTTQCVDSFNAAQKQRLAGKLLQARRELVRCSQPDCPEVVTGKCVQWLEQINAAIPSVVVAARDERGRDVIDARLFIDGAQVSERMDGAAIELAPGPHRFEVRHKGRSKALDVLVREGEKRRRIDLVLAAKQVKPTPGDPAGTTDAPLRLPAMSWIGFGTGALGLVLGTATGIAAIVLGDELQSRCEQGICHPPEQEELRAGTVLAHASTASFILAGGGVGIGVLGLLLDQEDPPANSEPAAASLRVRVGLGSVALEGRF